LRWWDSGVVTIPLDQATTPLSPVGAAVAVVYLHTAEELVASVGRRFEARGLR